MIRIYGKDKDGNIARPECMESCGTAADGKCSPYIDFKIPDSWLDVIRGVEPEHWNPKLMDGMVFREFDWMADASAARRIELLTLVAIELGCQLFQGDEKRTAEMETIKNKFYMARRASSSSYGKKVGLLASFGVLALSSSMPGLGSGDIDAMDTIIAGLVWMIHLVAIYDGKLIVEHLDGDVTTDDFFSSLPDHADPRRTDMWKKDEPEKREATAEEKKSVVAAARDFINGLSGKNEDNK